MISSPIISHEELHAHLKSAFGYDAFRPQQEEIIRATLHGSDVFALLPTGGGKSLCYQLPALLTRGLTVVLSPLIALMKDQVDGLEASGIPATFLNSTLNPQEARERLRLLESGALRLLYIAPERLFVDGFIERLNRWNVDRFAIDEAHCISEWGHDFRPEYRRLGEIRRHFPQVPIIAMTATATARVRTDIIHHLSLNTPQTFVASFNRPNLQYYVVRKAKPNDQILQYIQTRKEESGIIYCASRKGTEALAEFLQLARIPAAAYHAGLSTEQRSRTQDAFLRDEIRVICATTAFGMGVNKPNVRFVLHHDLPKSIEGYYQETGRAGRDGLPADCVLLFGHGDIARQARQIEEKPNDAQQQHAFAALAQMVSYAEGLGCRRKNLLAYFGENLTCATCKSCDNCLTPRDLIDATIAAQKILSCVIRIQKASGFACGLRHLIDVLLGKVNEKITRLGHDRVTTFGIGKEHSRKEWEWIARDLTARGFLTSSHASFPTISLTALGRASLIERCPIFLSQPIKLQTSSSVATKETTVHENNDENKDASKIDPTLFEALRVLRRKIAEERDVPAYIIFSDVTLRELATKTPLDSAGLRSIHGIGEKKAAEFGERFIAEIRSHLQGLEEVGQTDKTSMASA